MADVYALHEGGFGRAVVLELRDDLVAHAHAESQFAFWLGGPPVEARLGDTVVRYSEDVALGTNEYESHDARLLERSGPAIFLVLYISKDWLEQVRAESGRAFFFPRRACRSVHRCARPAGGCSTRSCRSRRAGATRSMATWSS